MTRTPGARVLAAALAAGALLATAACSANGDGGARTASDAPASPVAGTGRAPSPGRTLTAAGARAALVTEADLEDDWSQVKGAERWRDRLLVGTVDVAAFLSGKSAASRCQRLIDALYDNDLLGKPEGASALAGFQQGDSRLLYQVAAYDRGRLDDSLAWLKSMPVECDEFTVIDPSGARRTIQVTETALPKAGDARQGLHVTVQGRAAGDPATVSLGVAAVRVGTDAITVTAGGLDGFEDDTVNTAVGQGAKRLKDVQAGRTPPATPGEVG
ncbi:hypothetical protein AB0K80_13630 [Streptomyces sp. NPDC052682]|uniref:hypothetical protein n=1 Tax=Streptomyces sp. NPDC052682 TaxID=3154954 RepID=UPI00344243BE